MASSERLRTTSAHERGRVDQAPQQPRRADGAVGLRQVGILDGQRGDAGGLDGASVGKIEIHDRRSYVAVACAVSRKAVRSLDNGRIKRKKFRSSLVGRFRP